MRKSYIFVALSLIILTPLAILWLDNQSPAEVTDSRTVVTLPSDKSESDTSRMYASMQGDDFDRAYLADMITHHQSALNMASQAREVSSRSEIKTLSDDIIYTQSNEVQQMIYWQQEWGYLNVDSSDPHAGHYIGSNGSMSDHMDAMEAKLFGLAGEPFDREFLVQMIEHHQQAIDMSKYADANAEHQELKDMARQVIAAQQNEILQMKRWQQEWGN